MPLPIPSAIRDAPGLWVALAGLGAFHGLNPGMGWLFALALGLQQQSGRAVWAALLPIAAGHAVSLALVAGLVGVAGALLPQDTLRLLGALTLLGFGLYKVFTYYRHPRWVGMRVGPGDLCRWSFLMATAHGAGLMAMPLLIGIGAACGLAAARPPSPLPAFGFVASQVVAGPHLVWGHGPGLPLGASAVPTVWALAIGVHTVVMLLTMGVIAWIVYQKLGLAVLRRGWINFDLIWAAALLAAGGVAIFAAM